jgi:hypothetical protein
MLYTDADIISLADLTALDLAVAAIATANKIVFDPSVAWNECRNTLLAQCQLYGSMFGPGLQALNAAVLNTGSVRNVPRFRLNQIITNETQYGGNVNSALKSWIMYRALFLFFRDASNRLGKDKYADREKLYKKESEGNAWRILKSQGIPVVYGPMDCPGAKYAFSAGSWGTANTSSVSGGTNASVQVVLVAITYYDSSLYASQTAKGNAESAPSVTVTQSIAANNLLHVDITSLSPPNGTMPGLGTAAGIYAPLNATHWNIYAGLSPSGTLYLQKEGIPIATKLWTLTGDPVYSGSALGNGQWPNEFMPVQDFAMRG